MEVTFQNQGCPCLKPVLRQARNAEQSQEIKLAEGMPDVGRILTAWGQPILRGKEWGSDGQMCIRDRGNPVLRHQVQGEDGRPGAQPVRR